MTRIVFAAVLAATLSACGTLPSVLTGVPVTSAGTPGTASDAASFGGLSGSLAAHASVELGTPAAYALSPQGTGFLEALDRVVEPMRLTLAGRLKADSAVTSGLSSWERSTNAQRLAVLQRVATIEGEVMNCSVPTIVGQSGSSGQTGLLAYYQPAAIGNGQVVIYTDAIAKSGKYMAVATLVHEMRHAAQDQLIQQSQGFMVTMDGDDRTLATAYSASWQAMNALGGEAGLAYGDYTHLNVEFDAFQTGNEVAAILSAGQFDATGIGFVDTHYTASGTVGLDLTALSGTTSGAALVAAVNKAEYQAEKGHSGSITPVRGGFPGRFGR